MRKALLTTAGWLLQNESNRKKAAAHMRNGDHVCIEIMQEDLGKYDLAEVIDRVVHEVCKSGGGWMLLSFDVPEGAPEVWNIYECRRWADGLRRSIEAGLLRFGETVPLQRGDRVEFMDGALALLQAHDTVDVNGGVLRVQPKVRG
jgi:hypothetical protein